MFKKILKIIAIVIVAMVVAASGYVAYEVHAFDTSMAKEYQAPLPSVARTTDATALARGKHLAESLGAAPPRIATDLTLAVATPWRWGRWAPLPDPT